MSGGLALLQGTVDILILKALARRREHGFAISRAIREGTDGALGLKDAALYQALHRMERKGWIASEWGTSEHNRRAKYYELTTAGRRQLRTRTASWRQYATAVFKLLDRA
jgi:transcriptional regulator